MNATPLSPMETWGVFLAALLLVPIMFCVCLRAPRLVATAFIVVLFGFSSSTWGQIEVENTIYSRGVGMFNFPLLALLLLVAGTAAMVRKLSNPQNPTLAIPLSGYVAAFVFLMLAHTALGLFSGVEILDILSNSGIINLLYMLIFMAVLTMAFHSEEDKRRLLWTIIILAGIRAVFGLARYVFFGGDTANPYRNFERLEIKIFYFDIGDNYVAAVAAFCAAWLLTMPGIRLSLFKRLALYGFLALEVAAVALSFRRSSLLGLALMFLLLFLRLPARRRMLLAAVAAVALTLTLLALFQNRLQFNVNTGGGMLSSLIYDIAPDKGINESRWYELYAAARSLHDNWLFGLGTWGTYDGDRSTLDYHFGKLDFVHSGFGHIVLKTGVAGLLLFLAFLGAYTAFYLRHRNRIAGNSRLMADAGYAGFLFWIPTLLIGTPIVEFRTMLLIGLTMAMPFIAIGVGPQRMRAYAVA